MTSRRVFRAISLVSILAALLLLYGIHPVAGWTTLAMLAVGTVVARRRRVREAVAK